MGHSHKLESKFLSSQLKIILHGLMPGFNKASAFECRDALNMCVYLFVHLFNNFLFESLLNNYYF